MAAGGGAPVTEIAPEFLQILACPVARVPLVQVGDWLYATDPATRRRYPIRDGLPILLVDESEVIAPEEYERVVVQALAREP